MVVFEEIYDLYLQKVFRLCMGFINDYAKAQDLTQEAFIIIWQQQHKFRGESNMGTWIFRIAANLCLRQIERENKLSFISMPSQIPEENVVSIEPQLRFLYQCIASLPETDRLIISMELEDIKQSEIASVIGISEGNVRIRIHRIKEKLSQKFKEYEP